MSSINLSTGIPDLPPDLIWRVKERHYSRDPFAIFLKENN